MYQNKHPLSGVDKIYDFGEYLRICFASGYHQVYPKREMVIEQSCLTDHRAQDSLDYLKQLAKIVSITGEDDRSLLSKQYDKITHVSPNSVVAKCLHSMALRNSHQPLKMLIRDPQKLDKRESRYAMNVLTHTDFLIFNKLDKMLVLVVEVDGYAFHANNPEQLERDKMKDSILQKYGIPILRVRTNESGEEARLHRKLVEVLG